MPSIANRSFPLQSHSSNNQHPDNETTFTSCLRLLCLLARRPQRLVLLELTNRPSHRDCLSCERKTTILATTDKYHAPSTSHHQPAAFARRVSNLRTSSYHGTEIGRFVHSFPRDCVISSCRLRLAEQIFPSTQSVHSSARAHISVTHNEGALASTGRFALVRLTSDSHSSYRSPTSTSSPTR